MSDGGTYIPGGYTEVGKTADGSEYVKSPHTTSSEDLECRPEDAICVDDYENQCTEDRTVVYSGPTCMYTPTVADVEEYLNRHGMRLLRPGDKLTDPRKIKRVVREHPPTRISPEDFGFRSVVPPQETGDRERDSRAWYTIKPRAAERDTLHPVDRNDSVGFPMDKDGNAIGIPKK